MSFWNKLPKPFFASAPMAEVTDAAFRALVVKCGKPDVMWTEFVSADGLYALTAGRGDTSLREESPRPNPLMRDLQFTEAERPIVAQIFSANPETLAYAAKLVAKLGFDGVDLNMGCPDKSIEKQGAGAALIKTPALAVELIEAAKSAGLPVSVKTRIGYHRDTLEEWLTPILSAYPAALTLHLRTRKELSRVPADWERMKYAVELRDRLSPDPLRRSSSEARTLLIGNGDVTSRAEGERLARETGCDGIMIGRGMFGNPWVFEGITRFDLGNSDLRSNLENPHGLDEKLAALVELAHDFEKLSPPKNFAILKKHIKAFVAGFPGAAELRSKLMQAESAKELESSITGFIKK